MLAWDDVVSSVSAAFSAFAALVAVYMAVRAERRSRKVSAAQIYLDLRSRFLEIYTELGNVESDPSNEKERAARAAYWHHSFDEWYLSNRLAPEEFGDLWKDFYRKAGQAGLRHSGLQKSLEELRSQPLTGFGSYAADFVSELDFSRPGETAQSTDSGKHIRESQKELGKTKPGENS